MSRSVQASDSDANEGIATELPSGWARVDESELPHRVVDGIEHVETGLRVTVARQQRPDQMHDARTARMDTGYVATVRGDDVGANLTVELAAKAVARDAAGEFAATYPDGEFDVPPVSDQPYRAPIDWRVD